MRYPRNTNSSQNPADSDSPIHTPSSDPVWGASLSTSGRPILTRLGRLLRAILTTGRACAYATANTRQIATHIRQPWGVMNLSDSQARASDNHSASPAATIVHNMIIQPDQI